MDKLGRESVTWSGWAAASVFVHTCGCACISRNGRWACSWLKSDVRNGFYTSFYVYDGSGAFVSHVHPTECNGNVRWYYTPPR